MGLWDWCPKCLTQGKVLWYDVSILRWRSGMITEEHAGPGLGDPMRESDMSVVVKRGKELAGRAKMAYEALANKTQRVRRQRDEKVGPAARVDRSA